MGIYFGVFENPCPRCGVGVVGQTFISVSPMSVYFRCGSCDTTDFTAAERQTLGDLRSV